MRQPPKLPRGRACTGKVQHRARQAAERHLQNLVAAGAAESCLQVYRCRLSSQGVPHWHVGHARGATWSR